MSQWVETIKILGFFVLIFLFGAALVIIGFLAGKFDRHYTINIDRTTYHRMKTK